MPILLAGSRNASRGVELATVGSVPSACLSVESANASTMTGNCASIDNIDIAIKDMEKDILAAKFFL